MWTSQNRTDLIEGIYEGKYNLSSLPYDLFIMTFGAIISWVEKGFRGGVQTIPAGTVAFDTAVKFRRNINLFSGAKTANEAADLLQLAFMPDGSKRPFKEYRTLAANIDKRYNGIGSDKKFKSWLKTEQNTAFAQAQGAEKWQRIIDQKEILPYLKYVTVGDDRVRDEHAALDGVIKKVGDSFWDVNFPPNAFNCRCDVIQLDEGKETNLGAHLSEHNKLRKKEGLEPLQGFPKPPKLFRMNPGKDGYIFKETGHGAHPYFKIDKRFEVLKRDNNYGLGFQ